MPSCVEQRDDAVSMLSDEPIGYDLPAQRSPRGISRRGRRNLDAARPRPMGSVSLVVPTLNEARNIGWLLERVPDYVDEIILVDGRSTDGTVEVARQLRPDIRVVLEERPGKGAALRAGFEASRGDYIVMIDADGSMHPQETDLFTAYLDAGYDFVKGSRFMLSGGSTDMTLIRRLGHWPLLTFTRVGFRVRFTDLCYGYCAFRRSTLEALSLKADGFEIETELLLSAVRAGLTIAEVPSWESPRISGESNLHALRDGTRVLKVLLRERFAPSRRPVGVVHDSAPKLIDLTERSSAHLARPRSSGSSSGTVPRTAR